MSRAVVAVTGLGLALVLAANPAPAAAQVYKCLGDDGKVSYQQAACGRTADRVPLGQHRSAPPPRRVTPIDPAVPLDGAPVCRDAILKRLLAAFPETIHEVADAQRIGAEQVASGSRMITAHVYRVQTGVRTAWGASSKGSQVLCFVDANEREVLALREQP